MRTKLLLIASMFLMMALYSCNAIPSINNASNDNDVDSQSNIAQETPPAQVTPTLEQQISIVKVVTGFDPNNSDNLWLPCLVIEFKNISSADIRSDIKVSAIFVDNNKDEQMSSDFQFLSSDFGSDLFLSGTKKQIKLNCTIGWYALQNQNVSAKIYLNDSLVRTVKIDDQEFDGMIQ